MILIRKQKEPESLRVHRNTPGSDFDSLDKTELRKSLLSEQGYLCAYCMRRIREDNKVKIEHYTARTKENEMIYSNLLAVCDGNETLRGESGKVNPDRFTCDTRKGGQVLHIDPQNLSDMQTVYYDNKGIVYSTNKEYEKDLNEILNLNDPNGYLIRNREAALKALIQKLKSLAPGQDAMPLLRKLEKYCFQKNEAEEYPDYAGILQWYVKRKIKKHS